MTVLRPVHEELVTRDELAAIMRVSVPALDRMRRDAKRAGTPMPEVTWGLRLVRFRPSDVLRWAEARDEGKAA